MDASWLREELRDGLAALFILRLPGSPAGDTMPFVVDTWFASLTRFRVFDAELDRQRFRDGFLKLATGVRQWPSPRDLLDALPGRAEQLRLPRPRSNPAVAARALEGIAEILGVTPREPAPPPEPREHKKPEYLQKVEADLRTHYRDQRSAAAGDSDDEEE